jgi:hypothetical protein
MKKFFCSLFFLLPFLLPAQLVKTLKKTIELKMPGKVYTSKNTGGDSLPGTKGAAVAWDPLQKKYYAAFAGNMSFPLAVFDATGKRLSDESLTTMIDTRGLWYSPKMKKICGNGYNDLGWFSYELDRKGIPEDYEFIAEGKIQPDNNSIGVLNTESNMVCFLDGQYIVVYGSDFMEDDESETRLYPGISRKEDIDEEDEGDFLGDDYNFTVLIYTGIPKAEFGLINAAKKEVELYNQKTGLMTQILRLPADLELWKSFNFGYANGIYWAFNQGARTWVGYK